jgi:ABC-type multidrug transport system fused ATPase/permease subunit
MAPPPKFFKPHGSIDSEEVDLQGKEFFRLMKYFRRRHVYIIAALIGCVAGCVPLSMQLILSNMLTLITGARFTEDDLSRVLMHILIMAVVQSAVMTMNMGIRVYLSPAFTSDMRHALYKALMARDVSYFDLTPTGILVSRLSQDVMMLFQVYLDKSLAGLQLCFQELTAVTLSLRAMWQVALPCLGVIGICGGVYVAGERILKHLWANCHQNSSFATSKGEEIITSFRTIKSFDCELCEADRYREAIQNIDSVFKVTAIAHGAKDAIAGVLVNGAVAALLFFGSWFIVRKPELGYGGGDIMVLMMAMIFASMGVSQGLSLVDDFNKARIAAAKVLKILETPPQVDPNAGDSLPEVHGKIEFVDVGFRYETRDEWAVRHLSFTIEPGETVALIGESGCGKSTTLQLLQRFYEIQEGQILIDGVDIKTLSPRFLRSKISIVPQGPILFSLSVIDNIRFAKLEASEEEVTEAARVGNAHDFIMDLPDRYDTVVHQTSLSGGQKQRICICRAILANSPILLLDEATAALDTESEQLVQQSLEVFRQGKTAIVVAHRLATVRNAHRILVFKDGRIEESGTHAELLAMDGLYSDLIRYQLQ